MYPQKIYLLTSLHALIRRLLKNGVSLAPLLCAHLSYLTMYREIVPELPYATSVPELPVRYTNIAEMKSSARLWIARLEFERSRPESAAEPDVRRTWKQARDSVRGEGALEVWTWGVPSEDIIQSEQQAQAALKLVEVRHRADSCQSVHSSLSARRNFSPRACACKTHRPSEPSTTACFTLPRPC